jgi:general stress protein 26
MPENNPNQPANTTSTSSRPDMPKGYGLLDVTSGSGLLPWSWVDERMAKSRSYWIATTRPDGRPHVMPVWGIWLDGTFYFGTERHSRKARNLAQNPELVVHLESGDEAVILEGVAEEVTDSALRKRCINASVDKYHYDPGPDNPDSPYYALRMRAAFAWLESDFPGSATRWLFGG